MRLQIYEPPRFFEALLRGRGHTEPPGHHRPHLRDLPGRLPDERLPRRSRTPAGSTVDGPIADLRRLLYCGEWISSHALHIYLLHAPDFLGYPGAVELASDHRTLVERGLALKKAGNAIMELVGGRAIHPVNVRVGGFYRSPDPRRAGAAGRAAARARSTTRWPPCEWVAGFDFPDFSHDHELLALRRPGPVRRSRAARPPPTAG